MDYNIKYMYDTTIEELREFEKQLCFDSNKLKAHYVKNGIVLPTMLVSDHWDTSHRTARGGYAERMGNSYQRVHNLCGILQFKEAIR